jgi:entericidin B
MVRKIATLVAITATLVLAACNTVRGVGQDLESAANEVDEET